MYYLGSNINLTEANPISTTDDEEDNGGSVDCLLEQANVDLQRMERTAARIRDTIAKITERQSKIARKNFDLERININLTEENVVLRKKNLELRQRSLQLASCVKTKGQASSTNIGTSTNAPNDVGNEVEAISVPRLLKRRASQEKVEQAKKTKYEYSATQTGRQSVKKMVVNANNELLMASEQDDDDNAKELNDGDNHLENENVKQKKMSTNEEDQTIYLNGFDSHSCEEKEFHENEDEEFASEQDFVNEAPITHGQKRKRKKMSSEHKDLADGNHISQNKGTNRVSGKVKDKKKVTLKTLGQMGAIVDQPLRVISKTGVSNNALRALPTILKANVDEFNETLTCDNMSEMEEGKILLVKDVYDPSTHQFDMTKCGFQNPSLNKHTSGWHQKLMRLDPDNYDFIEMTPHCKGSLRSDFKAKTFFKDGSRSRPYEMNSKDVYVHFMQRSRYLLENENLTIYEIIVLNVYNAPNKMHILNSAAYSYVVLPTNKRLYCYPPGKMMPHPTVHADQCLHQNLHRY